MLERLANNWPLKLLSLALAFSIWASMKGQTRVPANFSVPLTSSLPEGYTFLVAPPTQIDVRLEGPRSQIGTIDQLDLVVRLDLRELPVGEHDLALTSAHLSGVPNRVDLVFFNPDRVRLSLDRRLNRRVALEIDVVEPPGAGYHVYSTRVSPETVIVEGPATEVDSITTLRTDPISLKSHTSPYTATVSATPRGQSVDVVDPEPIKVRFVIDQAPVERGFEGIPVEPSPKDEDVTVFPAAVRGVLRGPPRLLDQLGTSQLRPVADLSGVPADGRAHAVPVILELDVPPEQMNRIQVVGTVPRTVSVRLDTRSEQR